MLYKNRARQKQKLIHLLRVKIMLTRWFSTVDADFLKSSLPTNTQSSRTGFKSVSLKIQRISKLKSCVSKVLHLRRFRSRVFPFENKFPVAKRIILSTLPITKRGQWIKGSINRFCGTPKENFYQLKVRLPEHLTLVPTFTKKHHQILQHSFWRN